MIRSGATAVTPHHLRAEFGKLSDVFRRARVMRPHAAFFRCETERYRDLEIFEGGHLAIEPCERRWAEGVRPAQPGSEIANTEFFEPFDGAIETMVLEVKPLADADLGGEFREMLAGELGRAIFPKKPHVEMAIISGPFGFTVPRRRRPGARQIEEAVPVNARRTSMEQLGGF